MNKYTRDRMIAIGAACAVVVGGVLSTAPASAVTPDSEAPTDAPRSSAELLTTIRTELVASGSTADVAAFDDLSAEQREQLASYFLDVSVAAEVEADATLTSRDSAVVLENGDFAWGEDESVIVGEDPRSSRAASRTTWGTQWFAFAGIKLSETKVTMTYQYSGSNATRLRVCRDQERPAVHRSAIVEEQRVHQRRPGDGEVQGRRQARRPHALGNSGLEHVLRFPAAVHEGQRSGHGEPMGMTLQNDRARGGPR
ncbi:hypothetical protein [Curtobacterium sp. 458]